MPIPESYKAFRRTADGSSVEMTEEKLPSNLKPNHVVIRIHAVSLNYRDVAMMNGKYPVQVIDRGIPASDCAAEVITVGSEVKHFNPGDRVAPLFDLKSITGTEDEVEALGGDADGVLRQYAVFDQTVLVHLPKLLSWEEVGLLSEESQDVICADFMLSRRQPALTVRERLRGKHLICHDLVALHCSKVSLVSFRRGIQSRLILKQKELEVLACLRS